MSAPADSFDLAAWRRRQLARLEARLEAALPAESLLPARLHAAMRHGAGGGKRIRAQLVQACGELLGAPESACDACAVAVELIHAYSLVHDDLPCMDDDALRRGQPTVHKAWDEATAVLAGDALQSLAFEHLAHALEDDDPAFDSARRLQCIRLLARAAGSRGMCGGQTLDLQAEHQAISIAELEALHVHKTGELILACGRMAAAAAGADVDAGARERVEAALKRLGLAFQIQDDLLDGEADTETLGKTSGKDRIAGKATFPGLLGVPEARNRMQGLYDEARALLAGTPGTEALRALLDNIAARAA